MFKRLASRIKGNPEQHVRESYAQCGEDLIIDFLFQQLGIEKPSYIDIGAHHPMHINNTYLFYRKGARGINIEPDPSLIAKFHALRSEDTNLNIGIGTKSGEADFYIMSQPTLNTFVRGEAERMAAENTGITIREVKKIPIHTIADIISTHCNGKFPDLLSIDVEGLDEEILRAFDYAGALPKVMCVETLTFSATKGQGEKKNALIGFIKDKGYMVYADTYINTIFVQQALYQE